MPGLTRERPVGEMDLAGRRIRFRWMVRMNWRVGISVSSTYLTQATHLDSHHHVHMFHKFSPSSPALRRSAELRYVLTAGRLLNADDLPSDLRSTQGFSSEFYGEDHRSVLYAFWMPRRIGETLSGGDVSSGVCETALFARALLLPPLN